MKTQTKNETMNETANTIKVVKNKKGDVVRADKQVKVPKQALKLTCTVTGSSRPTNQKYLDAKASKLGVSVDVLMKNYVSKAGLKQIESDENYPNRENLLRLNGKSRIRSTKKTQTAEAAA
jgi:hypothetical protein